MSYLFVALGGAVGAMGRYAISLLPFKPDFPALTFLTNLLGALLIGLVAGLAEDRNRLPQNAVLFWKTGVCGGFTTFSTFSLESHQLMQEDKYLLGTGYMILSVVCCLAGVYCGKKLAVLFR